MKSTFLAVAVRQAAARPGHARTSVFAVRGNRLIFQRGPYRAGELSSCESNRAGGKERDAQQVPLAAVLAAAALAMYASVFLQMARQ